ncbi:tripartite tricarboxylate transporter substrate binding protein [Ferrovibrio terrae]|uniref:Bug family tripartite tricarboxylate transporter substrate binding protein n=1 Tax=Ferrovibrio terrae TaxID=2594003 RepID=UPI003137BD7D
MRRILILTTAVLAAATFGAHGVQAQAWPDKPVTFVVPFPAGGGTDAFARPLAAHLGNQIGKQVVIDNRGGAGGTVGAGVAARAAPDGYTFFIGGAHHAIAPSVYPKLDYDIEKDFVPVALLAQPPQVVVINTSRTSATTLKQLIDEAKAKPGKLSYGSAGNGTSHHLAGELFKILTKTDITHVPYRGAGPAMQDLVGGQGIEMIFDGLGSSAAQIKAGRIKALAVASAKRSAAFPDVPTAKEAGLDGYEVSTWYAMWAPKGTPAAVVERMAKEVTTAMNTPEVKEIWKNNGSEVPNMTGAAFGTFLGAEIKRWAEVAKASGARID